MDNPKPRLPSIQEAVTMKRKAFGWTQGKMAEALVLGAPHYSEFLRGRRQLPHRSLHKAYVLGIPPEVLLQPAMQAYKALVK